MSKKIVSVTIPPDMVEQLDQKVKETHAKSRSAYITRVLKQHLDGWTFSLSEEEHTALRTYAKVLGKSPQEVVKQVLNLVTHAGEKVDERFNSAVPIIPTD